MPPSRRTLDRLMLAEQCRRSFSAFVREFWPVVEPGVELVWGWHLDAICDHLQAVTEGRIRKLMIAIPPGYMKSLLTSVFWQPWEWTIDPSIRELYGSYDESLTYRDSLKARDIIKSNKYQQLFNPEWEIRRNQDSKGFFINSYHGARKTFYMGSRKKTGWRADRIVIDDPLSAESRFDKRIKAAVIDTYDRVISTRTNNPKKSSFVIIMQRLADDDLIGHILERYPDEYEYLMLPMEFEPERRCHTSLGFSDPRSEPGELLCEGRHDRESLDLLKAQLGPVDSDAQLQHKPHPDGGNRFNTAHFRYWRWIGTHQIQLIHNESRRENYRVDLMPKFVTADLACSENTKADWTVLGLWAVTDHGEIALLKRVRLKGNEPTVIKAIQDIYFNSPEFGQIPPMWAGVEANGLGLAIIQGCRAATPSVPIIEIHVHRDKEVMAAPAIVRIEGGQMFFPSPEDGAEWLPEFISYLVRFPGANHDDDVSMVSLAANSFFEQTITILGKPQEANIKTSHSNPMKINHTSSNSRRRNMYGVNR